MDSDEKIEKDIEKELSLPRSRKNYNYSPVVNVSLSGTPRMGRVSEVKPGQGFWRKRNVGFYIVIGDNCYTEAVKDKFTNEEKVVVVFNVSDKLILTVSAEEWVVMANKIEINVS